MTMPSDDPTTGLRWLDGASETVDVRPGTATTLSCGCRIKLEQVELTPGTWMPSMSFTACDTHYNPQPIYLRNLAATPIREQEEE